MKIFQSNHVSKRIDTKLILKDFSLVIDHGERIAIVGHNGSGKSSLLKLICGLYEPSKGKLIRSTLKIGYVPEHFPENICFTIMEYLLLLGKMSNKKQETLHKAIDNLARHFEIEAFLNTPLKNCSKGTKQKAGIIQALLLDPELLIMDEPLTGLDEKAQAELLRQLSLLDSTITIVFAVHDSFLIDNLASRVITMENGRLIKDSVNEKKQLYRVITVTAEKSMLEEIAHLEIKDLSDSIMEITVPSEESDAILALLLKKGCSILELKEKR